MDDVGVDSQGAHSTSRSLSGSAKYLEAAAKVGDSGSCRGVWRPLLDAGRSSAEPPRDRALARAASPGSLEAADCSECARLKPALPLSAFTCSGLAPLLSFQNPKKNTVSTIPLLAPTAADSYDTASSCAVVTCLPQNVRYPRRELQDRR